MHSSPPQSLRWQFLGDGYFSYPRRLLAIEEQGDPVRLFYRALLLDAGSRILVDTGAGPLSPTRGALGR